MSITASSNRYGTTSFIQGLKATSMVWDEYASMPGFGDKLTLVRIGRKKFVVKRQRGAPIVTYKCGYPEAQRRFALLVITRRLTA